MVERYLWRGAGRFEVVSSTAATPARRQLTSLSQAASHVEPGAVVVVRPLARAIQSAVGAMSPRFGREERDCRTRSPGPPRRRTRNPAYPTCATASTKSQ